jgi:serine/threonine protein kinase
MPSSLTCPDDGELLAVAAGEAPSAELRKHLAECPECRARQEQFQAELAVFRQMPPAAFLSPCTAGEPASDPSTANGRADASAATAAWQAADSSETRDSEPETDLGFTDQAGGNREPDLPAAIGKYLVIGRFPPTGQAEVLRVIDPGLDKDLVLKLSLEPVRPDGRCEIIKEGKILAGLDHPNLVQVYYQDFHDDRPYLVMEYIRGRTLEQLAGGGHLEPRQAAALLAKVAAAADYAHRHGIFHRDIKPKNILVDESGEPRLIDFAMARLRHAWSDDPGSPGGTFAFMAPEQALVESPEAQDKVGARSDVFAVGAVLYNLLTGKPPYAGRNWRESMDRARRCDFDREALNDRKIPRALRRICLKAMAADPNDRYATAEEFERALRGFLRRPALLAVGAALLLIAAIIAPAGLRARPNSPTAVDPIGRPAIEVHRGDEILSDLKHALPLRTGDKIRIRCAVPAGYHASAFWLDPEARLTELRPLSITPGPQSDQLVYPRPDSGRDVVPVEDPPGTELLLICARPHGEVAADEVRQLFAGVGRLPHLGPRTFLVLDGESVVAGSRGIGAPEPSQVGDARARLEPIRHKLRERFDFVAGLAIPHADTGLESASQGHETAWSHAASGPPSDPK